MFQKTRENQFKAAEFADVKDRVKEEYVNQKAFNALETMLKRKYLKNRILTLGGMKWQWK